MHPPSTRLQLRLEYRVKVVCLPSFPHLLLLFTFDNVTVCDDKVSTFQGLITSFLLSVWLCLTVLFSTFPLWLISNPLFFFFFAACSAKRGAFMPSSPTSSSIKRQVMIISCWQWFDVVRWLSSRRPSSSSVSNDTHTHTKSSGKSVQWSRATTPLP